VVAGPHEAERAAEPSAGSDLIQEDLEVAKVLLRRGTFTLALGGMIQVQGAFYVGDASAIAEKDPADTEGFRIRRARFGLAGDLFRDIGYYLAVDLKDTVAAALGGDKGTEILDAKLDWHRFPWARVSVGVAKVPFSAFGLQSSGRLLIIERPLMVRWLSPEYRVGMTVEGRWRGLQYGVGIYNGSEGVTSGNRLAGVAGAFRAQYTLLERPASFVPRSFNVTLGGAYMIDDGPAVLLHRAAGSLLFQFPRGTLMGELIWQSSIPHERPAGDPDAGEVRRWGAAGEAGVFIFRELLQLAGRYEYYHDTDKLELFARQQLITAALNLYLFRDNFKLQINYTRRDELRGAEIPNDIGFAQLQGMF
jgi:phosphate-selective porin